MKDEELPEKDALLLAALTRDARHAAPPEVDFDRIEAALEAALAREPVRLRPRSRAWTGVAALVAAAAAGALFFGTSRTPPVPAVSVVTPATPLVPVAPAHRAEHVETGAATRSFTKEGLATWVLEPGAVADVTDEGERVVLALSAGVVRVDVVPQPVKERFVVLVDHTRVAVHGTSFRVARTGGNVDVDVEHGVVAVGGLDAAPRWMLNAPIGGTFRADASAGDLRPLAPCSSLLVPTPPRSTGSAPRAVAPEKRLEAAELRTKAVSLANECFQRTTLPANVQVTVETAMRLSVDASGAVVASFEPPLAPTVEGCVREGLLRLKAQPGTVDAPLTLVGRK